mmetsp:Transcript_13160/g.50369  ORF Transcript_13160/g.50369 Transcript_13160/m.50369 type:complete len:252 (-) Transcript_13160:1846-2601(-)
MEAEPMGATSTTRTPATMRPAGAPALLLQAPPRRARPRPRRQRPRRLSSSSSLRGRPPSSSAPCAAAACLPPAAPWPGARALVASLSQRDRQWQPFLTAQLQLQPKPKSLPRRLFLVASVPPPSPPRAAPLRPPLFRTPLPTAERPTTPRCPLPPSLQPAGVRRRRTSPSARRSRAFAEPCRAYPPRPRAPASRTAVLPSWLPSQAAPDSSGFRPPRPSQQTPPSSLLCSRHVPRMLVLLQVSFQAAEPAR